MIESGRSPLSGSGHSAEPEPEVVSAVPVSIPNACECGYEHDLRLAAELPSVELVKRIAEHAGDNPEMGIRWGYMWGQWQARAQTAGRRVPSQVGRCVRDRTGETACGLDPKDDGQTVEDGDAPNPSKE
jgi:hypothetical protein